jgi:hypothetical protein
MAQPGAVFELADVKLAHGVAAVVGDRPVRNVLSTGRGGRTGL